MRSRRIFINIVGWILGGITGTIAMMLVAKYSGSVTLGIFAYAIAFFNTFAFPSTLDLETAHLRILPSRSDDDAKARAVGAYGVIRVALSLVALTTLLIAVGLGFSETIESDKVLYLELLSILFVSSALNRLGNIPIVTFAAYGQTAKQQISLTVGKLTRNLCMASFGVLALGAISLSLAYAVGGVLTCATAMYLFRGYKLKLPKPADIAEYLRFGGPMMVAPVFSTAIMSVDKLFVGEFWGESQLGIYFLAQSFAMSLMFIDASVKYVFIPGFVQDIRDGKFEKIGSQANRLARYIYLAFIPTIVFVMFFGETYFQALFGGQFADAAVVLAIQLIGVMALFLGDPLLSVLVAEGKSMSVLVAAILGLASSILMLVLFVPESIGGVTLPGLGIKGAAMAFATAFIVQVIYYRVTARRIKRYISPRHFAITLAVPCIVAFVLTRLPAGWINYSSITGAVAISAVYVCGTLLGLVLTRTLSRDDLKFLMRAISIRDNARYIREEMGK